MVKDKQDGTALLTRLVEPGAGHTWAPLSEFQSERGISTIFGPKFNRHLGKMTLLRGLDFLPDTNHNYSGFLGNYASCDEATVVRSTMELPKWPTIDAVISRSSKFYAQTPAVRSVHVGFGNFKSISSAGPQVSNPQTVFNALFGSFTGGAKPPASDPSADARRAREAFLIDKVFEDYKRLQGSPKLSKDDKSSLDSFVTLLTEVQERLKRAPTPVVCAKPGAPAGGVGDDAVKQKWDLFADIIAAAVICDQTRVATLDVRKALTRSRAIIHDPNGFGNQWHGLEHSWSASAQREITEALTWVAENVFLRLVEKLDVGESGGNTYLDNSLIYWGGELGGNHLNYSVQCMLAGGAGGFVKPGRYIDYVEWDLKCHLAQFGLAVVRGIPHNQFCNTVLQAMGLSPSDYERSGMAGFGERKTTGKMGVSPNSKSPLFPIDYRFNRIGEVLPGIRG
jgi:hypothetical protein